MIKLFIGLMAMAVMGITATAIETGSIFCYGALIGIICIIIEIARYAIKE